MADIQRLLKQNAEDGFFADDDPLAELARIANFDPQGETRPKAVNARREPEFNLEDELLKEFEQFEEPVRHVPSVDLPAPDVHAAASVAADEPVFDVEPAFEEFEQAAEVEDVAEAAPVVEPEPIAEPVRASRGLYAVPQPSFKAPEEPVRPAAHPVFDLEDEIFKEFAAFDARRAEHSPMVEPPVAESAAVEAIAEEPVPEVEPEPVQQAAPVADVPQAAPVPVEPEAGDLHALDAPEAHAVGSGYGDDDLAVEAGREPQDVFLEASALEAMEAEVDPDRWHESKESIFADERGFAPVAAKEASEAATFAAEPAHAGRWDDEVAVEPPAEVEDQAEAPVFEEYDEPVALSPAADTTQQHETVVQAVTASVVPPLAAKPEQELQPTPPPPVSMETGLAPAAEDDSDLDALLADVERYPVAAPLSRQPVHIAEPIEAPEVEKPLERAVAPAVATAVPVLGAATAAPVESFVEPKEEEQRHAAAAAAAPQDHEALDDGAFELDLTEIELDMLEMEVESTVAAAGEDHIAASVSAPASVAKAAVETKPVQLAERSFAQPPRRAEDYSSLPFDPSQVISEDDPVEALADMDVPDAPVVDHDVAVPAQPDYDIDIDAEMAHIFSRPADPAPSRAGQQVRAGETMATAAAASADLDEFERALEEDFRRSLSENRATGTPDRVALTPSSYDDGGRRGSLGRRLTILAASVAGLVLIGGAAVYAYWGSPSHILSTSSEPKIILADKDPVKVLPKDPGGQVVPNQDKAVYERVSGDDLEITKQDRLVTSNEEPVDVVQKTLMPENLPMDEDDQANTASDNTTDTTDPRLLPDGQDKNITTTEKTVSGVSPHKVRTMVVRSDGTLVPRDDDDADTTTAATDTKKDATPAEQSQERSLDVTPAADQTVPERLTANDDIAKQIEAASAADSKSFVPEAKQPSDAVEAKQPVEATNAKAADAQVTDTQVPDTATTDAQPVTNDQPAVKTEEKPLVTENDNAISSDKVATDTGDDAAGTDDKVADTMPVKKEELAAPANTTDNSAADDKVADTSKVDTAVADEAKPVDQSAIKEAANADVEDTAPIREVKTSKISANAPIPANRPVDQPVDIVGRVTDQGNVQKTQEVANADPVQQPADNAQTVQTPAGAYVIQIASLPSEADARNSYNKLSAKFASVIGGRGVDIRKAAIKNRGTYYRVRIPAGTRQEATELCSRYKAAGGSCLVSK